ncbi:transposable element Tcb1 transposase [Trichonephila clavipes]|nr:transposable element Tcb1 transposase [Trichonephila clavipes]
MEAGWSARRVAHQLGHSDCVERRCCNQWILEMSFTRRPGSGRPRQASRREDHHMVTTHAYRQLHHRPPSRHSDESRFSLSSDDNRAHEWRLDGERLNPAFTLQRQTAPTAGVMVWGAIANNTRPNLLLIRGTTASQWYVHDILQPHVLPFMQWLPGAIFEQDNAQPHTARVSQDCLRTFTTLSWPSRSSDLSPIEHIWDHLGRLVGYSTSLNMLEARLQEIYNEMFKGIMQNSHASMCDRIASCIRVRGGLTWY